MNTRNRFLEISQQIVSSQSRFVSQRRLSNIKTWGHTQHPNQPRDPSDVQREESNLRANGRDIAGELFQESINDQALENAWQVLAEAVWYALGQLSASGGIDAPSGNARDWFIRNGWEVRQRLVGRTTPDVRRQIETTFRERFNNAKAGRSQGQTWGRRPSPPPVSEAPVDSDTFILDVLQFFFQERLQPTQLNDHLRRLAAYALNEAIRASSALDFVPRPPSTPPSINWLVGQAVQIAFRRIQREQGIYESVRTTVQARLRSEYELAKMDVSGALNFRSSAFGVNNLSLSQQGLEFIRQTQPTISRDNLRTCEDAINSLVKISLTQSQYDALVSFCNSITVERFQSSRILNFLNQNNINDVLVELRKWVNNNGTAVDTLIRLREREAVLFERGEYSHTPVSTLSILSKRRKNGIYNLNMTLPSFRPCCMLTSDTPLGTNILDPTNIGTHGTSSEQVGIIYTGKAGFVDLGHLRETCDITKHVYDEINAANGGPTSIRTMNGVVNFFQCPIPSLYIDIAMSVAYADALGHEIVSYNSSHPGGHNSSFSPEDLCSNYLGTVVAQRAIAAGGNFNSAVTTELNTILSSLDAQTPTESLNAFNRIKSRWVDYSSALSVMNNTYLKRRNFTKTPWQTGHSSDGTIPSWVTASVPTPSSSIYRYTHTEGGGSMLESSYGTHINTIRANAQGRYGADFDKP